jgi:hypothetical protein
MPVDIPNGDHGPITYPPLGRVCEVQHRHEFGSILIMKRAPTRYVNVRGVNCNCGSDIYAGRGDKGRHVARPDERGHSHT